MICNSKELSPDQKAAIESLLGRQIQEDEAISIRAAGPAPEWLQKAWSGAKERGLERLTPNEIQDEIDAYRRDRRLISNEDAP